MPKARKAIAEDKGRRFLFKKDFEPTKDGKWYPADDVPKPRKRSFTPGAAKLRQTLTPGTVVILLSGRFRGKRAVFLRQLPSGLLLVSGPFAVNGVPLRRVNQAYVIATSTKVDVAGVKVPAAVTDAFFSAKEEKEGKVVGKDAESFFAMQSASKKAREEKTTASAERKAIQAGVDASIKLSAELKAYLKSTFSLSKGDKPHEMKF